MRILFIIFLFFLLNSVLLSQENTEGVKISEVSVKRKSAIMCRGSGNTWENCTWILSFKVTNSGGKSLRDFCILVSKDAKRYNLCYGKRNKTFNLAVGDKEYIRIDLKKYFNVKNEDSKPDIKILKITR